MNSNKSQVTNETKTGAGGYEKVKNWTKEHTTNIEDKIDFSH